MAYTAAVLDSQIDVSDIRDLLVQGDTAFPTINFTLPAGFTGLTWRVRGTFMQFNLATQSEELAVTGSTTVSIAWPVGSNFTTYYGEMQIVLVGTDALGNIVIKATGYVNVQRDFSISTVEIVDENLFEQLMAELSSSSVMLDQADEQEMTGGVLKLAADRVISDDHHIVDKKHVADVVASVTADDFNHNDLANKQGGTTNEYYHVTSAEKTVISNTSGTNTGDQDVSGAISTHNTDAGAHANLGIVDTGGYYDATTVEGALQESGSLLKDVALFNVKKYGAIGDGVTADTTAIQAAFDAVNAAGGGTVYFPDGVYLTNTITVYSNTCVTCRSYATATIKLVSVPTSALFNCAGTSGTIKTNISFDGLHLRHIYGYVSDNDVKGALIYGNYNKNCRITRCLFDNYSWAAVVIKNTNPSAAYYGWDITGNLINGDPATANTTRYGIRLTDAGEYCNIAMNRINVVGYGVSTYNAANNAISDNMINGALYSVHILHDNAGINEGKTRITANTINHSGAFAITVTGLGSNQSGCVITGNIILLPTTVGIYLRGGYGHCVTGNRILTPDNTIKCIMLRDNDSHVADYCLISSNVCQKGVIDAVSSTGINNLIINNLEMPT